jgi:hypothetical protein
LLVIVPRKPRRNDAGMEMRPGLRRGNHAQSAFGNIDVGVPDTAGENMISVSVINRPPVGAHRHPRVLNRIQNSE